MNQQQRNFIKTVRTFYVVRGRATLPWRNTTDPYRVVVSEIMLQQTQVERVLPKYKVFLKAFPTTRALALAPLKDVLMVWQGLGYNRRAKFLHECAKTVVAKHHNRWPKTRDGLLALPGIGPYTAGAVMAFAYNEAVPLIETNIRTAYLHHFFNNQTDVSDAEIVRYITRTLDTKNPREWYWALMDYGAYLKQTVGNKNVQSKHYQRQSVFTGSNRQLRGAILRTLLVGEKTRIQLLKALKPFADIKIDHQLDALLAEGLVTKRGYRFTLPS